MYTCGCFLLLYAEINTIIGGFEYCFAIMQSIILQLKSTKKESWEVILILKSIIKCNITYDIKWNVHHNKKINSSIRQNNP